MLGKCSKIEDFSPKSLQKIFKRLFRESVFKNFHSRWDNSIAHAFAAREGSEPVWLMTFRRPGLSKMGNFPIFPYFSWNFPETFLGFSSRILRKIRRIGVSGSCRYQNFCQAPSNKNFRAGNVSTVSFRNFQFWTDLGFDSLVRQTVKSRSGIPFCLSAFLSL